MRCPGCGASYGDVEWCAECETGALSAIELDGEYWPSDSLEATSEHEISPNETADKSTLIEFPGKVKNTVPEWRRELSERVRVVQERRAREAAQEAAEAERRRLAEKAAAAVPQLELLPQAAGPPLNPLVAAALRRIERANQQTTPPSSAARAPNARMAAVAYAADDRLESITDMPASACETHDSRVKADQMEKPRNLVAVPAPANARVIRTEPTPVARRLISENDAVLDYLVKAPATLRLNEIRELQAGMLPRVIAALLDLIVFALLFSPFPAVIELTNGDWYEVRTAAFAVVFATFVTFIYLTFSTALTGRTLGMRILSLRTVDRRTGLIPTGAQSVGRAVIIVASLFALGLPVLYALIQREGHTVHDHLTGTVVVRA